MIYIKTYCYSEHELEFIKAQLIESYGFVDKVVVYEYNVTHRGERKPFRMANLIDELEPKLKNRLIYRPVDIDEISIKTNDSKLIHEVNESIQRSYFFNDSFFLITNQDIIFDVDADEIIYAHYYPILIALARILPLPIGLKLNQFFYRKNYLWRDAHFKSPAVYRFGSVLNKGKSLKHGFKLFHQRDLKFHFPIKCGAHLSWIMPVELMVRKLQSYSHPEYEKFAKIEVLERAIENKEYIFDLNRSFNLDELRWNDSRIPLIFRKK